MSTTPSGARIEYFDIEKNILSVVDVKVYRIEQNIIAVDQST